MRNLLRTIVYLVFIGLPLTKADEPKWQGVVTEWKAAADDSAKPKKALTAGSLVSWIHPLLEQIEEPPSDVVRPAWPQLKTPEPIVYPPMPELLVGKKLSSK